MNKIFYFALSSNTTNNLFTTCRPQQPVHRLTSESKNEPAHVQNVFGKGQEHCM